MAWVGTTYETLARWPYAVTAATMDAAWSQTDVNAITVSSDSLAKSAVVVRIVVMENVVTTSRLPALVSRDGVASSANETLSTVLDTSLVKMEVSARMEASGLTLLAVARKVTLAQLVRLWCPASVSTKEFVGMVDSVRPPTRNWADVNALKVSRDGIVNEEKLPSTRHALQAAATMVSILMLATCVVVFFLKYKRMRRLLRDPVTQNAINEHRQIHELPKRSIDCRSLSDEAYK
ncbi:hypothetical protein TELCIR_19480, partial [Teladorsagia circumcincta]